MKKRIVSMICIIVMLFGLFVPANTVKAMNQEGDSDETVVTGDQTSIETVFTENQNSTDEIATAQDAQTESETGEGDAAITGEENKGTEVFEISGEMVNPRFTGDYAEQSEDYSGVIDVVPYGASTAYASSGYVTASQAAGQLREAMTRRETEVTLKIVTAQNFQDLFAPLMEVAFEETGSPVQGDYLAFQCGRYAYSGSYYVEDNLYYNDITFTITYLTTAAQEQLVDSAVASIMSQLNLAELNEYEKVKRIYDYITANVTYNYTASDILATTDTSFSSIDASYWPAWTAYGAICNWSAYGVDYSHSVVCQGYANLFYRLAREAGLSVRTISGTSDGQGHAWNIVRIGDLYYNLDTTWDAGADLYAYFLKGASDFSDHTREDKYRTSKFQSTYPMAATEFNPDAYVPVVTSIRIFAAGETDVYENQTLSLSTVVLPYGVPDTSVTWTSSNSAVAAVDANGLVTAKSAGSAVITATSNNNPNVSKSQTVTVRHMEQESIVMPTCTQTGVRTVRCGICDAVINSVPIPALGHSYNSTVVAPTYEQNGYTVHTCQRCGDTYKDQEVEKLIEGSGWKYENSLWSFIEDGVRVKGWKLIDGTWYYFDDKGIMKTGWIKDGGTWYYLKGSGAMATGWIKDGGDWYYLTGSGAMATGWIYDGAWYYLTGSGAMATGWIYDGAWYYLTGSGAMATGWIKDGGTWYYLRGSGAMVTGVLKIGRRFYRFNSSGAWIG